MGGIPNISLINSNTILVYYPVVHLLIISLAVCRIVTYLLMTDFGLSLRSIGQNKRLAQNRGVDVAFMIMIGLALSNAIIALGGGIV